MHQSAKHAAHLCFLVSLAHAGVTIQSLMIKDTAKGKE